ncbi:MULTISPECIES: cobyric acid synthase [Geobacter]|uniref:cobyric acid synthase n=1 Tax=Geobacter TaxID=28231 RepID=UPI002572BEBC|nr:cobyric acid synthase [Geobacter sulfurreducens]BEH11519.1 cobyric acid synthase [Geobacter sulfurreducens subsp. ethanolicus]BET59375.1 cobyric acid synthase [Geobacter sp. 60473]
MSILYVVGIGPGDLDHMTFHATEAIERAQVVVGYKTYLGFIEPLLDGKEVVSSGMMKEVDRCREALDAAAAGKTVALVSSGDAGVYGMAGLAMELAATMTAPPEIVVVPGVSAVQAAASVLGAPLMHDFAVISLSDLLTPWDVIERRLVAAAAADFVVALYNPRSKGRVTQIEEARTILLAARASTTPVGIVRNACREGEARVVTTLAEMLDHEIDMFSLVIIGNSATFVDREGRMVTPRGYKAAPGAERPGAGEQQKNSVDGQLSDSPSRILNSRSPIPDPGSPASHSRSLMVVGTASDVGKSVVTAGICRIMKNRGFSVAPFKSQNMALNSAVTPEGGEIGRAQAVQAEACGIEPHTDMNPILLKPTTDCGSQVIVQGAVVGNMTVREYNDYKPSAFEKARESFGRLAAAHDLVVIEGAGSIAEINLKRHDIANLKVAEMAGCKALLVADIDRGGVFAQIVGTLELLEPHERERIAGVIINKFRGDASLLAPGIGFIEERTGVPVLGVVPCFSGFRLPEEDSVALEKRKAENGDRGPAAERLNIGVVKLSRISNYTDFDALEAEPDVQLTYVEGEEQLRGLDLLVIPGSKATTTDLFFLMERGLFPAIKSFTGPIVGICGGYQMLGKRVADPHAVESDIREAEGLGLLDVVTVMLEQKSTHRAAAELLPSGFLVAPRCRGGLAGYEIHLGETILGPSVRPFARITSRSGAPVEVLDGAVSSDGRVFGTYLHGIFDNAVFRTSFLNRLRKAKGLAERRPGQGGDDPFNLLAAHLEKHLNIDRMLELCGLGGILPE